MSHPSVEIDDRVVIQSLARLGVDMVDGVCLNELTRPGDDWASRVVSPYAVLPASCNPRPP